MMKGWIVKAVLAALAEYPEAKLAVALKLRTLADAGDAPAAGVGP